jgi:acyl carrier protein
MDEDVMRRTIAQVAETKRIPEETVGPDSTFQELGLDSLDAMNLLFALEEEFDVSIPDAEARAIRTVHDAAEGVSRLLAAKQASSRAERAG